MRIAQTIDRLIGMFSPAWGVKRAIAREQLDFCLSTFAAAEKSRLTAEWPAKNLSADLAVIPDMDTINARARAAERDDWAAGSIVDGFRRHVVGVGIGCRAAARDADGEPREEFNRKALRLWSRWCEDKTQCDAERRKAFLAIQQLAITELTIVGQAFAALEVVPRDGVSGLRIKMFAPEQLDPIILTNPDNGNEIRRGIEEDADGAPVAYWVYDRHPNDYSFRRGLPLLVSKRYPAEQVLHLMRPTQVGQSHGYTRLARVLPKMRKATRYDDNMSIRAAYEAAIGMTIESQPSAPSGWLDYLGPSVTSPEVKDDGSVELDIQPGMCHNLPPGKTAKFHVPTTPGGTYQPYMHQQLKEISAGAGLDYPTTARDFDFGSFSSQRQALIERDGETDPLQDLLITDWILPIYRLFIKLEIMAGRLDAPEFGMLGDVDADELWLACQVCPPGKPWVDPANQAAAAKIMIEERIKTRDQISMEINGCPINDIFDQIDDEQEYATEELATGTRPNGIGLPELQSGGQKPAVNPREPQPRGTTNAPTQLAESLLEKHMVTLNEKRIVSLATAADADTSESFSLAMYGLGGVDVDVESGQIRNVAIIRKGPAKGWGFDVDDFMLQQVVDALRGSQMPSHFTHSHAHKSPGVPVVDGIGTLVGHIIPSSVKLVDGTVRGDVQLGKFANNGPNGALREFLLNIAQENPRLIGLSIVFLGKKEVVLGPGGKPVATVGRIIELTAVDFVESPAANPNGLLSAADTQGEKTMNPELRAYLESKGLKKEATEAEAIAFALSMNSQADLEGAKVLAKVELASQISARIVTLSAGNGGGTGGGTVTAPEDPAQIALAKVESDKKAFFSLAKAASMSDEDATVFSGKHALEGTSFEEVRKAAGVALAAKFPPTSIRPTHRVTGGGNEALESLPAAIEDAIMLSNGYNRIASTDDRGMVCLSAAGEPEYRQPDQRALRWRGVKTSGMMRIYLSALGVPDVNELSNVRLAELIGPREFRRLYPDIFALAQGIGDFGSILANVMGKTLRQSYMDRKPTWQIWARRASAPDFKEVSRTALSESPNLQAITDEGIKYVSLSDGKEVYALSQYNSGIKLTRRAFINDDQYAFSRIPMLQAAAASRKEEDVAYVVLTANADMSDGNALFDDTNHANKLGSGGAAPYTVAALLPTWHRMRKQKGPKGVAELDLVPKFLLCPVALEIGAQQFIASTVDPSKSNSTPNPYSGRLTVVANPRLDVSSATKWYLAADYRDGQIDTVEVCFLDDEPMPVLKQETEWDTEDVKFAVRHTVAAKAIDWRGLTEDKGAA